MFTCSSCGYEANPDSAPACSLCGTKKPGAGGSAVRTAPKPVSDNDELANAAKAVADSAELGAPAPRASAKGKGGPNKGAVAVETHTGILRMPEQPPDIMNSAMVLGAFVGTLVGYFFSWSHAGHAPASFTDLLPMFGVAIVFGFVGRFVLTNMLEARLGFAGRQTFAGPIAVGIGIAFLVFSIFAFWKGSAVTPIETGTGPQAALIGTNGRMLAEHVALLTPWNVKLKSDKHVVLTKAAGSVDIPSGNLTGENIRDITKAMALGPGELEMLASQDPYQSTSPLPPGFSIERFLEQLGPVYGVQKDSNAKPVVGKIHLSRRRSNGSEETMTISDRARTVGELGAAVPSGVPLWVAVALGMPAHQGAPIEHDQFVNEVLEKYGPR